jgi:multiple sugar transport system ATP-binding protein
MAHVSLKQVCKVYPGGVRAVDDFNLDIADGEFVVLVGPSGCGKSTTLRMVAGLEEISSGEIAIGGRVVNDVAPKDRDIAMVFQNYALYPHMTVHENMAFGLKLRHFPKAEIEERVQDAARMLGLEALLERRPKALSGGQRQRVAVGRAIVRKPAVFLFDEPLSNLDAKMRVQMRVEISRLHQRLGTTMIYVTHDQVEAMTLGDKIVVMHEGKVQQAGSPLELYQQPTNLFVAGFIGSPKMNLMPATVVLVEDTQVTVALDNGRHVRAAVDGSTCHAGDRVTLGLRAEHARPEGAASEAFHGRVGMVEHLGEVNFIYVTLDDGTEMVVRGDGNQMVPAGLPFSFCAGPESFHVFDAQGSALRRLRPGNMVSSRDARAASPVSVGSLV